MKNILISVPTYLDSLIYLPYIHALLKTHCEKDPVIRENYSWLEPVFRNNTAEDLLGGREGRIDVLGLSCYLWNWNLQLEIARRVKAVNPRCLVVMGGPHPDWKDPDFFRKYPDVDLVVKHDGEIPFHRILLESLREQPDYASISSLMVPDADRGAVHTGEPLRIQAWGDESVYADCPEMAAIAAQYRDRLNIGALWETNRGCPYRCSFCDWGSATYSKMRQFPDARLEKDLEFFAKNKINKVLIVDSNFGMFPRDVGLAHRMVEYKKNYGYPNLVHWSIAKNKAEPVAEIAKAFLDSELDNSVCLSIQSTQEDTIVEMGRGAHSLQTHKKLSEMIDQTGAPKIAQIILGSPGESAQGFINTMHDMMEMNFHKSLFLVNYAVLPNAPVAQPAEMARHGIQTIDRPANRTWGHRKLLWKWKSGTERIIVGHSKMSQPDWVLMSTYKTHVMCLHHLGPTRLIARAFRNLHGIRYAEFYSYFYEAAMADTGPVGDSYRKVKAHFEDYLVNTEGIYALPAFDPDWYIDHESALFCWMMNQKEELLRWLMETTRKFAAGRGLPTEFVEEILHYQINMLITPDYDPAEGRRFSSGYDFYSYFSLLGDRDRAEVPLERRHVSYEIHEGQRNLKDQIIDFNWKKGDEINLHVYQHRMAIGAYRRYMSTPVFEQVQTLN